MGGRVPTNSQLTVTRSNMPIPIGDRFFSRAYAYAFTPAIRNHQHP